MDEEFELKPITEDGVPAAIERAKQYRLLGQPEQTESICLDILEVSPGDQQTLVVLVLAITDQFGVDGSNVSRARAYVERLTDEYQRDYYSGIIAERTARAALERRHGTAVAYAGLREAMEWFEKAAVVRPPGNDEAILRWNACVRTLRRRQLRPRPEEEELGLE
jgi:hypothetical protein